MQLGIMGLPRSGKTTIFNALTKSCIKVGGFSTGLRHAQSAVSKSACDVHLGVVKVPDPRLDKLTAMFNPKKKVPATITYVDIGGMAKGGSDSGGLGTEFLTQMQKMDAMILVLRGFADVSGAPTPVDDYQTIATELLLSDLSLVERRIERVKTDIKKVKRPELEKELAILEKCRVQLEAEKPLHALDLFPEESKALRSFQLLTEKPRLPVLNYEEGTDFAALQNSLAAACGGEATALCGTIEMDIAQMSDEEAKEFLAEMKISEPALNKMIRTSYRLLGQISFFTVGEDECRAWTIPMNTKAPQAAGAIHSDLERGFIRAETVSYDHLTESGSYAAAREKGYVRQEGKEYLVKDGDVINIKFNV
ncbi:redox-regulated ATPase YchF [candidate division TA06 bacterium]|uniref:Redox-regulated ATPase YchF n=1 Tax=candidate division TA06 bacterium TaxID=2250710 RepID=A0A933IA50_UNCT6|nr:redox-regulated ATPase YchF [candidate division TA06 bacterium]